MLYDVAGPEECQATCVFLFRPKMLARGSGQAFPDLFCLCLIISRQLDKTEIEKASSPFVDGRRSIAEASAAVGGLWKDLSKRLPALAGVFALVSISMSRNVRFLSCRDFFARPGRAIRSVSIEMRFVFTTRG